MFDFIFANSYIEVKYEFSRIYLEETYDELKNKMNDSSDSITVKVVDITGFFSDTKTFKKADIVSYGAN